LYVDDAGDPGRAEQAGLAPRLPYHAGVDHRAGFDRLERVDLDPAGDERLLLDQALGADDRALIEPGGPHHVRVLAYDAAAQVGLRTDVDVVVHDRAGQERARAHDQ